MSVEIAEDGAVMVAGHLGDDAIADIWTMDNPENITSLAEDTQTFVTVIAATEVAAAEQQPAAREAFAVGRPKRPGASWTV